MFLIRVLQCLLTCRVDGWYLNSFLLLAVRYPSLSSETFLISSISVPNNSFFNRHEYARLSRADSPQSRCFLFDCDEFSFDFVKVEKLVSQLLFPLLIKNILFYISNWMNVTLDHFYVKLSLTCMEWSDLKVMMILALGIILELMDYNAWAISSRILDWTCS